jgi:hypothetical protein
MDDLTGACDAAGVRARGFCSVVSLGEPRWRSMTSLPHERYETILRAWHDPWTPYAVCSHERRLIYKQHRFRFR